MIRIVKAPFIGGGRYKAKEMCFNRAEALHVAETYDKLGREPVMVRPMPGTKAWFVWWKI